MDCWGDFFGERVLACSSNERATVKMETTHQVREVGNGHKCSRRTYDNCCFLIFLFVEDACQNAPPLASEINHVHFMFGGHRW